MQLYIKRCTKQDSHLEIKMNPNSPYDSDQRKKGLLLTFTTLAVLESVRDHVCNLIINNVQNRVCSTTECAQNRFPRLVFRSVIQYEIQYRVNHSAGPQFWFAVVKEKHFHCSQSRGVTDTCYWTIPWVITIRGLCFEKVFRFSSPCPMNESPVQTGLLGAERNQAVALVWMILSILYYSS